MKKLLFLIFIAGWLILFGITVNAQVIAGTYAIKNVKTGMLLRIKDANKANGTPLVSYNPVSWKCMTWDFVHKQGNVYQLRNLFSGKTFQPMQAAAASVAMEEQPLLDGEAGQEYEFINAEKNSYFIRLKGTELYLSPIDDKGSTNSPIVLAKRSASKLLQWVIYEQHPDF